MRLGEAEAFGGAGFCFGFSSSRFLGGAVVSSAWRRRSQTGCNFVDGCVEGFFVCFGRLVEAADLPDELQRGVANLYVGHGWIEVEEVFDVSAHGEIIGRVGSRKSRSPRMTSKNSKSNDNSRSSAYGEG